MATKYTGRYIEYKLVCRPRFAEIDAMGIMWHGNHARLLENLREDFGREMGMGYMDVYRHGFMTPIVHMAIDYKRAIRYEDTLEVHAIYRECRAAKIVFDYKIINGSGEVCAAGTTVQVFVNTEGELQLTYPGFYVNWASKLPWKTGGN